MGLLGSVELNLVRIYFDEDSNFCVGRSPEISIDEAIQFMKVAIKQLEEDAMMDEVRN